MGDETTDAVAVLGLPELTRALELTGVQVISGETFRSAAASAAAQIKRSPVPVVMADQHVPGTTPWVEKVLRTTHAALIVLDLPAGASRIGANVPGALRISAPVRVDEILASVGLPALTDGATLERDGTVTYPVGDPTDRPYAREIVTTSDTSDPGTTAGQQSSGLSEDGDSTPVANPALRTEPVTPDGNQTAGLLVGPTSIEDAAWDRTVATGLGVDQLAPQPEPLPPGRDATPPGHQPAELEPSPGATSSRAVRPRALLVTVLVIAASAVLALLVFKSTATVLLFGSPLLLALTAVGVIVRTVRNRP